MEAFSSLIAAPSVSSIDPLFNQSNRPVVEMLAGWFEDLGFATEIQLVSSDPDKLNLIACLGQGEGGLVLSGHTDTVPYDESLWKQDPFKLCEIDNRLYGLGSTDMKGFFPIVLAALEKIDLGKFNRPLFILATCDEESTMAGAKALVSSKHALGRHALIGEPTGLQPINMHKGIMVESIKLIGSSGHSSDPAFGVNALEGMHSVIGALMTLREEIQAQQHNPMFKVPVPTMNFASIHGGDNPNRICGDCELKIDMRMLPGMDIEDCRAAIRRAVMQSIDGRGLIVEFDPIFSGLPGMQTDKDAEIVKLAEKLAGQPTGTVAFGTEGPYFNSMGMETVILGPGDIDQAHQANEYLSLNRISPMINILQKMITHFCIK
ncbi:MAG: acetylornithine deacetylase [Gammaproteobacteria bacterium]|jgi:acetylornithine deacetylase